MAKNAPKNAPAKAKAGATTRSADDLGKAIQGWIALPTTRGAGKYSAPSAARAVNASVADVEAHPVFQAHLASRAPKEQRVREASGKKATKKAATNDRLTAHERSMLDAFRMLTIAEQDEVKEQIEVKAKGARALRDYQETADEIAKQQEALAEKRKAIEAMGLKIPAKAKA